MHYRVSGSVFEEALNQFFANASVISGTTVSTVANRKMVINQAVFAETFHLPMEGILSFSGLSAQAVADMKDLFSTTDVPFKPSSKKKDMKNNQATPKSGEAIKASGDKAEVTAEPKKEKVTLKKLVAGSYTDPAQLRSETSSDIDKRQLRSNMTLFDSWARMAKLEEYFMSWAETEKVSKLLQRRLLVQYSLYEDQLQESVDKHQTEFEKAAPSSNYDHTCIQFLERELSQIKKQQITWAAARTLSRLGTTATDNEAETVMIEQPAQDLIAVEELP
ncbi:tankyrase [Dorcoceras hygrometricum]|uniref:Tankyrase n=1 Tax=Dorcoceras hygrometricum TaxID=472368 RepID=A0A2Z7AGV5_9LAMI|nr:tankyrase [Dorcoceras hygrometricum]